MKMAGEKNLGMRLMKARKRAHFTKKAAAEMMEFQHYQTISDIENGNRNVKARELTKFSKLYLCSMDMLMGKIDIEVELQLLWRKYPADENDAHRIKLLAQEHCENYFLLEKILGMEHNNWFIPNIDKRNLLSNRAIDALADEIARTLCLGSRPAKCLENILENKLGIKILYAEFNEGGSAVSTIHQKYGPVIIINKDEAPWRRNYDLAHEFFHILTWDYFDMQSMESEIFRRDVEKKANRFASSLLLPHADLIEELEKIVVNRVVEIADIIDIAREFDVSTPALIFRLFNLRIIKDFDHASELANDREIKRMDKKVRSGDNSDPIPNKYYKLAVKCYRKKMISRGKLAKFIGKNRAEIDQFLDKWGVYEENVEHKKIVFT